MKSTPSMNRILTAPDPVGPPAPEPRDAGAAPASAALAAAAAAAQVLSLADESGLGLLHLGVVPAIPLAGATQITQLAGAAGAGVPTIDTLAELLGVSLDARWQALFPPSGYRAGGAPPTQETAPATGVPGTLLPVSLTTGPDGPSSDPEPSGGPLDPLIGLTQRLVPLPPLTSVRDLWQPRLEVTITARAQPRSLPAPPSTAKLSLPLVGGLVATVTGGIAAEVTSAVDDAPDGVTVGPIRVRLVLPTLAIPPIAILMRGENFEPPGLVICPVPSLGGSLNGLLTSIGDVLTQLDRIKRLLELSDLDLPIEYSGIASALQLALRLLSSPGMRVLTTTEEANLNLYVLMRGVFNDIEAENELSSLVYIGLPGPTLDLYPRRNFNTGIESSGDGVGLDKDRFLRVGVTADMVQRGRFVVELSDLNRREVDGVLHPADMKHLLRFRDTSSLRFNGVTTVRAVTTPAGHAVGSSWGVTASPTPMSGAAVAGR